MSEIRSVSVHLDADVASYIAKMRLAGAETDKAFGSSKGNLSTLNRQLTGTVTRLDKVSSSTSTLSTEMRKLDGDVGRVNRRVETGTKDLDKFSGRAGIAVDAVLALGPALIPIGAEAVPAVTALGSGLGFAAIGAGTAVLAFHGLGTALTAVNKAALAPTAANIAAAHLALDKLPPSAQQLVLQLHRLNPELDKLRQSAAGGIAPGLTNGLQALIHDGPLAQHVLHSVGTELGTLASQAGHSLASDQWKPFLRFVGHEAPIEIGAMGHSVGSLTHGLAALWMAFTPLNHQVDAGIVKLAQDFDRWATAEQKSRGFQGFMEYVDQNAPRVEHLLGAIGTTLVDVTRAAAPLGGPVLDVLTEVFKVVDVIAKSDFGTPLFAGVLALRLYTRTAKLAGAEIDTSFLGMAKTAKALPDQVESGLRRATTATTSYVTTTKAELSTLAQTWRISGATTERVTSGQTAALTSLGAKARTLGRLALPAAALGVAVTGVADKFGLERTASLAAAGSLAGPWGAAVGGAVGLALDFAAAQHHSVVNAQDLASTLDQQTGAITKNTAAYVANQLQQAGVLDQATKLGISLPQITQAALGNKAAIDALNGTLDAYQGKTTPGYTAGGANIVDPEQAHAAIVLRDAIGQVNGAIDGQQTKTRQLAHALDFGNNATGRLSHTQQHLKLQLQAQSDAAATTSSAFITLGKDVDNSKVSLDHWIRDLAHQAQALTNFGNNARKAADRGLRDGLIAELEAAGPAGALRMQQLANATQSQIRKANGAWLSGQRAIQSYEDVVSGVPNPRLTVDASPALRGINLVANALRNLHDRTVTVNTRYTGGHTLAGHADGGMVGGAPRSPYGDKVLIAAAPGEEVISNRHGQADQFRADRAAGRIPAYADGGTVASTHVTRTPAGLTMTDPTLTRQANDVTLRLHGLSKSLAASQKVLDAERQTRQNLVSAERQLASSVTSALRGDIFASTGSVWDPSGGIDPLGQLHTEITGDREFDRLLHQLHRRGVRGGALSALAQTGSVTDAQVVAAYSNRQLHQLTNRFRTEQRLSHQVGQFAGQAQYGAAVAEQTTLIGHQLAEVKHLRAEVHQTNKELAAIKKEQAKTPAKNAAALNSATSHAARRVMRTP